MPISSSTVSDALWMDSNSSSETTGVGGKRCFSARYWLVERAGRTVPLPLDGDILKWTNEETDVNIAPADLDVHDPKAWAGQVLCSDAERAALRQLMAIGLRDAVRMLEPETQLFTWWDYRMNGFKRNAGMRIDHVLLSESLVPSCTGCLIDKGPRALEQPSDHTPVVATLTLR